MVRVPKITAGQYGENLKKQSGTGEISSKIFWNALIGKWKIIRKLCDRELQEFGPKEFAELLLADKLIGTNEKYPAYLDKTQDNKYRANDDFYNLFISPRFYYFFH